MIEITSTQQGKVSIVTLSGPIDAASVKLLSHALDAQVKAGGTHLVADLGRVDYINSGGLHALLATLKETRREGGDFRLAALQPNVLRAFEIVGFMILFKQYVDVDSAVKSFSA